MEQLTSYLDTHVVVRLHAGERTNLSNQAAQQVEKEQSAYFRHSDAGNRNAVEKGIVRYSSEQTYSDLHHAVGITICQLSLVLITRSALEIKWTREREPGDRLITANAIANNHAPLITKDRNIREHYPQTIW